MKTKLIIFAILGAAGFTLKMHAQWSPSGADTYYNLSGNVEIGNPTIPSFPTKLYVETGTTGDGIKLTQTSTSALDYASLFLQLGATNYWSLNHTGAGFTLFESASGNIHLHVKNGTGNVGVGMSSPTSKLDVYENSLGTIATAVAIHGLADQGTTDNYGVYGEVGSTGGSNMNVGVYGFLGNNAGSGANAAIYGDANGYSSSGGTVDDWAGYFLGDVFRSGYDNFSSDGKLKENIRPLVSSLDKIKLLKPSMYNFKRNEFKGLNLPNGLQFGLVAQDLEKVFPELVKETPLPERDENGKIFYAGQTFKTVQYINLIPVLIAAVQEQQQQIEDLKDLLAASQQKKFPQTGLDELDQTSFFSMEQNAPNPFTGETLIRFINLPQSIGKVNLTICDLSGKQILNLPVNERGSASVTFNAKRLDAGIYLYSIIADGEILDSKRMIVEK